jgi:hypothetical protein
MVLPTNRMHDRRYLKAAKRCHVFERLENWPPERICQIDNAFLAAVESHSDAITIDILGCDDLQHGRSLQRRNSIQWLMAFGKLPVISQFVAMSVVPLHQSVQSAPWKATLNDACVDLDGHFVLSIGGMEVWWTMVVVEHKNGDAQKPGKLWHVA